APCNPAPCRLRHALRGPSKPRATWPGRSGPRTRVERLRRTAPAALPSRTTARSSRMPPRPCRTTEPPASWRGPGAAPPLRATRHRPMSHIIRELPGCTDLLPLAARHPGRYPGLLESVARGNARARHDILFAFPQDGIRLDGTRLRDL